MLSEKDQALTIKIMSQVKEHSLDILLMGKNDYIDSRIQELNSLAPISGQRLKYAVEYKLRTIFSISIDKVLGVECPA